MVSLPSSSPDRGAGVPSGDKYDARGFIVGVVVFLALGVGVGVVGDAGTSAWVLGVAIGAPAMNVTSFVMRRRAGIPYCGPLGQQKRRD
jgi:hypothetical protein